MRIIGYAYDADCHCSNCAVALYGVNKLDNVTVNFAHGFTHTFSDGSSELLDEHCIPLDATDQEGNRVHPIFATDEQPEGGEWCGDCHERIE